MKLTPIAATAFGLLLFAPQAEASLLVYACTKMTVMDSPNEMLQSHDLDSIEVTFSRHASGDIVGSRTWYFEGGQSYTATEVSPLSEIQLTPAMSTHLNLSALSSPSDYISVTLSETANATHLHRSVERTVNGSTSVNNKVCHWNSCQLTAIEEQAFTIYALRN